MENKNYKHWNNSGDMNVYKNVICDTWQTNSNVYWIFLLLKEFITTGNVDILAMPCSSISLYRCQGKLSVENKNKNDFSAVVFKYKEVSV